jgi:hypothetical protein
MNPLLIIAIPLVGLVIVGMILNSLDLGFVQPGSGSSTPLRKQMGGQGVGEGM